MSVRREIVIEGLTPDEVLALAPGNLEALALHGRPLVFRAGSAEVLGRFYVSGDALVAELGHVDGGGEGVLPALVVLAGRYARRGRLAAVEWRVHAVNCHRPNPKLQRVLARRGFVVRDVPGAGRWFHLRQRLGGDRGDEGRRPWRA
jgi:hypothetical protein